VIMTETPRLNIGSGDLPMRIPGWTNIDQAPYSGVDMVLEVPPLPWPDRSVSEIFAGHFLEHLDRSTAAEFLDECWRILVPGGWLGIVVPDMREVMRRYVQGEHAPMEWPAGHYRDLRDLDELCAAIIFSTDQPSHHQWAYDQFTLGRALMSAGFEILGEMDRFGDPHIGVGAWYQVGIAARKPTELTYP
jgi:predicted SAM-dependent methyltransferase